MGGKLRLSVFLGASVVSKALRAGQAGFPSCGLNPGLEAVILDICQHPDRSALPEKNFPHLQRLAVSMRFMIPVDW